MGTRLNPKYTEFIYQKFNDGKRKLQEKIL